MKKKQILPPTYFLISLIVMIILHFVFPLIKIITSPYNYFGVLLIVVGLLFNICPSNFFKKVNTTIKPFEESTYLVTEGLFKYSRHPMYLGMCAILMGVAIILGSVVAFLFPIIFVILMEIMFIPYKEKNLEEAFGGEYFDYKKKVRRWV